MNNYRGAWAGVVVLAASACAFLNACGHSPTVAPAGAMGASSASRHGADSTTGRTHAAVDASHSPLPHQRATFDDVDTYKSDAARHIMRHNADYTFSGALPPMLPAIVVVRITVDQSGKPIHANVLRSRDDEASKVALASIRRAGYLPMPYNLAHGPGRSLTYIETFLFNADYRFQLRTLAPIQ